MATYASQAGAAAFVSNVLDVRTPVTMIRHRHTELSFLGAAILPNRCQISANGTVFCLKLPVFSKSTALKNRHPFTKKEWRVRLLAG
jgi:hypothetical protein